MEERYKAGGSGQRVEWIDEEYRFATKEAISRAGLDRSNKMPSTGTATANEALGVHVAGSQRGQP